LLGANEIKVQYDKPLPASVAGALKDMILQHLLLSREDISTLSVTTYLAACENRGLDSQLLSDIHGVTYGECGKQISIRLGRVLEKIDVTQHLLQTQKFNKLEKLELLNMSRSLHETEILLNDLLVTVANGQQTALLGPGANFEDLLSHERNAQKMAASFISGEDKSNLHPDLVTKIGSIIRSHLGKNEDEFEAINGSLLSDILKSNFCIESDLLRLASKSSRDVVLTRCADQYYFSSIQFDVCQSIMRISESNEGQSTIIGAKRNFLQAGIALLHQILAVLVSDANIGTEKLGIEIAVQQFVSFEVFNSQQQLRSF